MVRDRITRLRISDKIRRNQLRSLMNKLIESVLPVSSWLSPDNRPRFIIHKFSISIHGLTIALHITLLKVSRKTVKILRIRQNSVRTCIKKVPIPNTQQCHLHWNIFGKICFLEMNIRVVSSF